MRTPAALLLLVLLLFPKVRAASAMPSVTRGEFVALIWKSEGAVPYDAATAFSDVLRDDNCATAVGWAYDAALIRGTGGGHFEPDRSITREEAAILLRRWAEHLGRDTFLPDGVAACNDYTGISSWADDSLYWATDTGLIEWSSGGRLDPGGTLTEGDADAIFHRFLSEQP